jgi:hypothetical protein
MEPHDTWVVDIGSPNRVADVTRAAVQQFAVSPRVGVSGVIRRLMVSATLRALIKPPQTIATATAGIAHAEPVVPETAKSAAIFGVSFRLRAKQTLPALTQCNASRIRGFETDLICRCAAR